MARPKKSKELSPIELIEKGIECADWKMVCNGFNNLTGKNIKPSVINDGENHYKKLCDQILEIFTNQTIEVQELPLEPPAPKTKKNKATKQVSNKEFESTIVADITKLKVKAGPKDGPRGGTVNARENKIVFLGDFIADNPKEKEVSKLAAAQSGRMPRPEYEPIMLKCSHCKYEFDLNKNPSVIVNKTASESLARYRCPKCREYFS